MAASNKCVNYDGYEDESKPNLRERMIRATREDNWAYITQHPEIRKIIKSFLNGVFTNRPVNIRSYAAEFARSLRNEKKRKMMGIDVETGNIL